MLKHQNSAQKELMFYQATQYIKFLLKSTNQHGVHSPFVYNLVTQCFYDKKRYADYRIILNYRKALKKDKTEINVTDLGAGSRVAIQKTRKVSEITKNAGTTNHRTKLLYRIVRYFKPLAVLELGTSLGIGTHAISLGTPNGKIVSIEGCPNISTFTKNRLQEYDAQNAEIVTGDITNELKKRTKNQYDLVFFDGNHQKEPTLSYFETLLETAHNDSIFIFDDIYWSKGMTEAWQIIKKHPKVTVTIDTFFWGLVFFRKEQAKEHFYIRL
ncbi:class I SAM-dependent methyltransferase [Flavobacteriaceae bacterium GSB9]|nr:class I SAM-dependent methyltransferase [Flavobacteriaceae bacterium GSB9]